MLKKLFFPAALFSLALSLSACESVPKTWNWGFKPRPLTGTRNFPSTETEYGKGFKDGCSSAWDAVSKGLLSDFHERKYDFKRMQKSADYNAGWWDGYEQCTYILDWDVV